MNISLQDLSLCMSWGRFSLNEIKDWTLYTYYLIEPVVTRLFDHSKLSQSKLGNPSSFSRSQTELGSILQMNKTKRNEGREKKLKFKSQYKNTFIFDWQNEKKSISYMSYGLNLKVPTIQQVLAKWAKISQSGSSLDPTYLYVCITYV